MNTTNKYYLVRMPLTLTNMTVSLTPVYSTTYAASVPSSINNAVTNWLFYFMIMDLSSMTIQFGIALPDLTQFTYDSQQISTTYFTSIGSTMSFVFSSGIIFNTGAPTPQTLTMIDTKIWLNLDFSVLTYRNLMDHPVTAWYRIPFTLIFPTILPVLGSLPSEPTLNSISNQGFKPLATSTYNQALDLTMKDRVDFVGRPFTVKYSILMPSNNFVNISSFYDSKGNYFTFACNAGMFIVYYMTTTIANTFSSCNTNKWYTIIMKFNGNPPDLVGTINLEVVTILSGVATTGTATLIIDSISPNRILTFSTTILSSTYMGGGGGGGGGKTDTGYYLKDLNLYAGTMPNYYGHNCLYDLFFQDSTLNTLPNHCVLCKTQSFSNNMICGTTCPSSIDSDTGSCYSCPFPSLIKSTSPFACSICGDGIHDTPENCDDGNNANQDGCNSVCTIEAHSTCTKTTGPDSCTCEPKAVSAAISDDWQSVALTYPANIIVMANSCAGLFTNAGVLGVGSICTASGNVINITLGTNATVKGGTVLTYAQAAVSYSDCIYSVYKYLSVSLTSGPTINPFVTITAPQRAFICQDLPLNLTIGGTGGRQYSIIWGVTGLPALAPADATAIIGILSKQTGTSFIIPADTLTINTTYTFTATVINFQNNAASSSVSTVTYLIPNVSFAKGDSFFTWSSITLKPMISPYYCGVIFYDISMIRYTWSLVSPAGLSLSTFNLRSSSSELNFKPFALKPKTYYSFQLSVYFVYLSGLQYVREKYSTLTLNYTIYIKESPITADILGGDRNSPIDQPLLLDGSKSTDPDDPAKTAMTYSWTCIFLDSRPCVNVNNTLLTFPKTATVTIPRSTLLLGSVYVFTLTAVSGSRTSTDRVKITITVSNNPTTFLTVEKKVVVVDDYVIVYANVSSKAPVSVKYAWTFASDATGTMQQTLFTSAQLYGLGTKAIKILPGSLTEGVTYQITMTASDFYGKSTAQTTIRVNVAPKLGKLTVNPTIGYGFMTTYVMSTTGWSDMDLPLQYKFGYWRNSANISDMTAFEDITQWSYFPQSSNELRNPMNADNMIYVYVLCKDSYDAVGISNAGVNVIVYPFAFPKMDNVSYFYNTKFGSVDSMSSSAKLESASLVAQSLEIYQSTGGNGSPVASAEEVKVTSDLIDNIISAKMTDLRSFESYTSVLSDVTSKPARLTSDSSIKLLGLISDQLNTFSTTSAGLGNKGTSNIGNILNSIVESQTAPADPTNSQPVIKDGAVAQQLTATIGTVFDSLLKIQIPGDSVSITRPNLNLLVSKVDPNTIKNSKINCTTASNQSPQITVPPLDFSSIVGQGADIGINYLNLKPNIYNASDPTLLKTDIVGLKLTTGDNNQEIPMSNLSTPFRIQIPYPKTEALGSAVPFSCIYFNQTTKKWDDKGCYFAGFNINPDGSRFADCRCNHLTDFSFSNSFNVIGNSGFQYLGSVSSAFANADFSNLKVLYVLIGIFVTNLFFITYGYYTDEKSKVLQRTLVNRNDVLNIGIKEAMKRKDPVAVAPEPEEQLPETSVNDDGVHSSYDSDDSFQREMRNSRARLRKSGGKNTFKKFSGVLIREKRTPSFFIGYCHALKKTHNFISIFLRYDLKLSRPLRFFLYFVRFYAMLAVGSIFFSQTRIEGGLDFGSVVVVMILSFIMTGIILLIIQALLTKDDSFTKYNTRRIDRPKDASKVKRYIGLSLGVVYAGFCVLMTLLVGISVSHVVADAIVVAFVIQMIYDLFINQPIKVLVHYLLIVLLAKQQCKGCRKILLQILDANIITSFV